MSKVVKFPSKVRKEGKITIPIEHRKLLGIKRGDIVEVSLHKPEWYELLNWDEIDLSEVNMKAFPKEAVEYIRTHTKQFLTG